MTSQVQFSNASDLHEFEEPGGSSSLGLASAELDEFRAQEALVLELWELQQAGIQEEEVLHEAEEAQEALAEKVEELRRIVLHAEAELHDRHEEERGAGSWQQVSSDGEAQTFGEDNEGLPPELARTLAEQKADIEALQARHHALNALVEQANHEESVPHLDDGAGEVRDSGGTMRMQRALREAEELERELDRLKKAESRLRKEHKGWAEQMHEEVREVEAQAQEERYGMREELAIMSAENEALDAEVEGARHGMEQVLQHLRQKENKLQREAHEAHSLQESRRIMCQSQIQELKAIARSLREEHEESRGSKMLSGSPFMSQDASPIGSRRPSRQGSSGGRQKSKSIWEELQAPSPRESLGSAAPGRTSEDGPKSPKKNQAPRGTLHLGMDVAFACSSLQKQAERTSLAVPTVGKSASSSSSTSNRKPVPAPRTFSIPVPQHIGFDQDRYTIRVDKRSGKSLGVDIDSDLTILAIDNGGLMADWNIAHSSSTVSAGHKIVDVNGRTETKPMMKLLKSNQILHITLASQAAPSAKQKQIQRSSTAPFGEENKSPAPKRKHLLRRTRSTEHGFNCFGAVRVNQDEEDRRSIGSSGDGDAVSVGGSSAASSRPPRETSSKKLSIIGEDSTITGDGSSRSSDPEGDVIGNALIELDAVMGNAPTEENEELRPRSFSRRISLFSLHDEEDVSSPEANSNHRGSLEARYDALDTMGLVEHSPRPGSDRPGSICSDRSPQREAFGEAGSSMHPEVFRSSQIAVPLAPQGDAVVAQSICSEDEDAGSGCDSPDSDKKSRTSIDWRYDTLDAGETVAVIAAESTHKGCRGDLEWAIAGQQAPGTAPGELSWAGPSHFEVIQDDSERLVLRAQAPSDTIHNLPDIVLHTVVAVRPEWRDPDGRVFSVRPRNTGSERVEYSFRTPTKEARAAWVRDLTELVTESRRNPTSSRMK